MVANGRDIKFWHDTWVSEKSIRYYGPLMQEEDKLIVGDIL